MNDIMRGHQHLTDLILHFARSDQIVMNSITLASWPEYV